MRHDIDSAIQPPATSSTTTTAATMRSFAVRESAMKTSR